MRPKHVAPRRFAVACVAAICAFGGISTAIADAELAQLIQDGDRRGAFALIDEGVDVNEPQGDGTTPLHWAVYRVDAELTALLLERGAEPSAINVYGSSPLAEAVKTGNAALAEMLLDAGADVDAANADGQTALMLSARSGSIETSRLLVDHGATIDAREAWRGQSALMWAADARFPELVDLLIEHGADVDFRAESIDWPSQITSEPRAQYRPIGGLTPLLYAARSGCTECVRSIVAAGADIDRPNPEGMTPLMIAIDNGAFDTAALLLESGANPHIWDWYGRTPLYIAVDMNQGSGRGSPDGGNRSVTGIDVIESLLEAGVNPNAQLNMHRPSRGGNIGRFSDDPLTTGATPLLRAAISLDMPAIHMLLAHGAHVDLPNVMGVTPLIAAAGMGASGRGRGTSFGGNVQERTIETLRVFLDAGADINARIVDRYNRTATIARSSSMTKCEGQTALYAAARRGWSDVVEFLIDNGADVDIVDARGLSPVDVVLGNNCGRDDDEVLEDIAEILRRYVDDEA